MAYNNEIINFSIDGFKRVDENVELNGVHQHVLKDKHQNFFGNHKLDFKLHRWAGSLKSSQAFAFNVFSGMDYVKEYEYPMRALDANPLHRACVDVMIRDGEMVRMYEVKMFELANASSRNKIFHKLEHQKYFDAKNYYWNREIATPFISFIKNVQTHFTDTPIYGEGIKQLCCHLLGIINEMTIIDGTLKNKKVELYSLCFDMPFLSSFKNDTENYKNTLKVFKVIVDQFLEEIGLDTQISYQGFLSASEHIKNNAELINRKNYDYISKRYFRGTLK